MLTRKRVLAAKIEATVGGAETLAAGQAAFNIFDATMQGNIEMGERPGQSAFSPLPSIAGARAGTCTFAVEVHGSGSSGAPKPAWANVFLPACGLVDSGDTDVFKPSTAGPTDGADETAVRTITIGLYEDGLKKLMTGCMGNAVFIFVSGKPVRVEFTFTGIWAAPTDVAILAPTYPTQKPPRFANTSLAIASWNPKTSEMRIDLGNEVVLREDSGVIAGYISAMITGRLINGTLNPESSLVATQDTYGQWLSSAEQALAASVGATADGNTTVYGAPKLQFTNPQEGDRNGIFVDDIAFQLNRSAAAGDDEFTITFS